MNCHHVFTLLTNPLYKGKTVVVHCNGGKGRSATVIVATLIAMGRSITDSIKIIQQTRKGTIRNPLQQAYLRRFRKEWNERQKRTKLLKGLRISEDAVGGEGGELSNPSGADEDSELESDSDVYDSEEETTSSLDYLEGVGVEMTEEDANKKLLRFQKRIESYEKKIEKRERALSKDRGRLEFYREEVRKVAGALEKKGRAPNPLKKAKSSRVMSKDSPIVPRMSKSPKEGRRDALSHKGEEREKDDKEKKEREGREEGNNYSSNHNSNNKKAEHKKEKEQEGEEQQQQQQPRKEKPRSKGSLEDEKQGV